MDQDPVVESYEIFGLSHARKSDTRVGILARVPIPAMSDDMRKELDEFFSSCENVFIIDTENPGEASITKRKSARTKDDDQ